MRIRYYTVPISYPIYNGPDGTYSYGSFNYDLTKNEWPGYGEFGPQGPYWVDGSPPPWPSLWLDATGDSEHVARASFLHRPALSSERSAEVVSRSLALARYPLSAGREAERVSRTLHAAKVALEAERCGETPSRSVRVTRGMVEPERSEESRSLAVSVSRSPVEAERMASPATSYQGHSHCSVLSHAHYRYTVVFSGFTNAICTDCANANRTETLVWSASCGWDGAAVTLCGIPAPGWHLGVTGGGGGTITLSSPPLGVYSVATGSWDGNSPITLTRVGGPIQCGGGPATVVLTPA